MTDPNISRELQEAMMLKPEIEGLRTEANNAMREAAREIERLRESNAVMLAALKGVTRTLDAVRFLAGLHGSQIDRLEAAKAAIAQAERK